MTPDPYEIGQGDNDRGNQSIIIDNGKYMAVVVVLAVVCGISATVSVWAALSMRATEISYRDSYLYTQEEFQKTRNHTIELEAGLKVLSDQVQENKHVRR